MERNINVVKKWLNNPTQVSKLALKHNLDIVIEDTGDTYFVMGAYTMMEDQSPEYAAAKAAIHAYEDDSIGAANWVGEYYKRYHAKNTVHSTGYESVSVKHMF